MAVKWTSDQQKVIDLRNRNILVSAAAGSGKTAVLVERIIQMVLDKEHPVDIDRLLVVTFTNAAAAEMRERVGKAIEVKWKEEPENEHLQRQMTLLHNSQITTIDSFCLFLIRNYFQNIELDPAFRIGDENELLLMKKEVAAKVLEEAYEEGSESFHRFVESYATGKTDEGIIDLILQLYEFSMSYPRPDVWLKGCIENYSATTKEELENTPWIREICKEATLLFKELNAQISSGLEICMEQDGPKAYIDTFLSDREWIERLAACDSFEKMAAMGKRLSFDRLASVRSKEVDSELKESAREIRDYVKKSLGDFVGKYLSTTLEEILKDFSLCRKHLEVFVELTLKFLEAFSQEKRENGLVDFHDVEHYALAILLDKDGNPTPVAREFSEYFEEIMIDEYQDSNLVQELLLTSMKKTDRNNIFMVGDVKQSIYKFRLARPELFMEKYSTYTTEDSENQKIVLGKNFRSRSQVLAGVNNLFSQFMVKDLGNVEYDEKAALYPGAAYPENRFMETFHTEILVTDLEPGKDLEEEQDKKELEARILAEKILQITDSYSGQMVSNPERTGFKRAGFGDIVVLFRTMTGWAEVFARVFEEMGVPTRTESSTGYFSSPEIKTILGILQTVDNPMQDIPLTFMLKAPFLGFSNEELAVIRTACPKGSLYTALENYYQQEEKLSEIAEKSERFFSLLEKFRSQIMHKSVSQLLQYILDETGYLQIVQALPDGAQKKVNLDMLMEKAKDFEKTSYHGLFHFIQYMDQMQKYDVDFGQADTMEGAGNAVRFMSIHKSKGLEFPIVFVAGLGKKINQQDARSKVVLHPDFGIGLECVDAEKRTRRNTILKRYIQDRILHENLGEELRVLYVALTRAKEKLYLSGTTDSLEKLCKNLDMVCRVKGEQLPVNILTRASCFMDWIWFGLARHKAMADFLETQGMKAHTYLYFPSFPAEYKIEKKSILDVIWDETEHQIKEAEGLEDFLGKNLVPEEEPFVWKEETEKNLAFTYPYEKEREIPSTISVTELKHRALADNGEEHNLYEEKIVMPYVPPFMQEEEESIGGNIRGTAYHRVMECLDLKKAVESGGNSAVIKAEMEKIVAAGRMSEKDLKLVSVKKVQDFTESNLARRMVKAKEAGKLYREQQFVMGISPENLGYEKNAGEPVLVQGIIDLFFEEDGELVLADYKTDRVNSREELVERYRVQLELYQDALEKAFGKKVKEKVIYSFCLGESISF